MSSVAPVSAEFSPISTRGVLQAPQTASEAGHSLIVVPRVITVELARLERDEWAHLRKLGAACAQYGNQILRSLEIQGAGGVWAREASPFRSYGPTLSGAVRRTVQQEAFGLWKRHGKKILSGWQRGALFGPERSLVIACPEARDVRVVWDGKRFALDARLVPAADGGRTVLPLHTGVKKDDYLLPVLHGLSGEEGVT